MAGVTATKQTFEVANVAESKPFIKGKRDCLWSFLNIPLLPEEKLTCHQTSFLNLWSFEGFILEDIHFS